MILTRATRHGMLTHGSTRTVRRYTLFGFTTRSGLRIPPMSSYLVRQMLRQVIDVHRPYNVQYRWDDLGVSPKTYAYR